MAVGSFAWLFVLGEGGAGGGTGLYLREPAPAVFIPVFLATGVAVSVVASGVERLAASRHPDTSADFAVGPEVLRAGTRPVLGVCLGMQGLVTAYGGTVRRLPPAHGDVAAVRHDGEGVFDGLPQGFAAVRYHSLGAVTLPDELVATAWSEDGVVMGVRHRSLPLEGVQFHPESVLSEHGEDLVRNFLS